LKKRIKIKESLGNVFKEAYPVPEVQAVSKFYKDAYKLMKSPILKAFDLSRVGEKKKEFYGKNKFGNGLILAKQLIQKGVRHVEIVRGGWDHHNNIYQNFEKDSGEIDKGISALLYELKAIGLLSETLIVLTTEFGRTPDINSNSGRDHFPQAFTSLLFGAGIKTGIVYGETETESGEIKNDPVDTQDWVATLAHIAGLEYNKIYYSPSGRPFKPGGKKGTPVKGILA